MKFIFIYNSGWHFLRGFEDLRNLPDVKLKSLSYLDNWRRKLYVKANMELTAPLYFLQQFDFNTERYVFIMEHGVLLDWGTRWIYKLKQQYGNQVMFVLTLYDSMNASSPSLIDAKRYIMQTPWNLIYTYDIEDAKQYGWRWLGYSYFSSYFPHNVNSNMQTDAYFIGAFKGGREQLILDVAKEMQLHDVNYKFDILSKEKHISTKNVKFHNKYIKYHRIQPFISNTNCIIEILQQNQHCQSYRFFEAVYYNKKLITNNHNIINYPFYDQRHMKIFDTPDQIDYDWIKEKENIQYGYQNEFSPINLLNMIKSDIL